MGRRNMATITAVKSQQLGGNMPLEVTIKVDFLPFGTFRLQVTSRIEEGDEVEKLKEKLAWPYELPEHTGSLRGPVSIWSTSA